MSTLSNPSFLKLEERKRIRAIQDIYVMILKYNGQVVGVEQIQPNYYVVQIKINQMGITRNVKHSNYVLQPPIEV